MRPAAILLAIPGVVAFLVLSGCSNSTPKTYSVSGKVTINGKSLESGEVMFHPVSGSGPGGNGLVSGGSYTADVPLGKFKVTLSPPPDDEKKQSIHRKYQNVKDTPLEVDVVESPATGAYDLNLTK